MTRKTRPNKSSVLSQVSNHLASTQTSHEEPEAIVEPVKESPVKEAGSLSELTLKVPIEDIESPTFRLHVDISLQGEPAKNMRRAAAGLDRKRLTLANGKRCVGTNDLVRWLAEQLVLTPTR